MSSTLSQWNPSVAAPDLSNVLKTAGKIGTDKGYAEFYEKLIKDRQERDEARLAEKEEESKAKEDLGNDPEGPGFFSKLGQGALSGLEAIIDGISRPLYGVANTAMYMETRDPSIKAFSWEDLKTLDDGASAFWKGFSGQEKTTFSQVLAQDAASDGTSNFKDNKWYQGGVGLGLDIVFDPLTYVGVGLITKPVSVGKSVKKGREVDETLDAWDRRASEIAGEFDKPELQLKRKVKADDGTEKEITLTGDSVYNILTGGTKVMTTAGRSKKANLTRTGDRVKRTKAYIEGATALKTMLKQSPDLDDTEVTSLMKAVENLRDESKRLLDEHATDAFVQAGKKFDSNPHLWPVREKRATKYVEESVSLATAARAFKVESIRRRVAKAGKKVDPKRLPPFAQIIGKGFDDALKGQSGETAYDIVDGIVKKDPMYRRQVDKIYAKDTGLNDQVKKLQDALEDATDPAIRTELRVQLGRVERQLELTWDRINTMMGNTFIRLLDAQVNGVKAKYLTPEQTRAITDLRMELDSINMRLAAVGDNAPTVKTSQDIEGGGTLADEVPLDSKTASKGPEDSIVSNEAQTLKRERDRVLREMQEAIGYDAKAWAEMDTLVKPASLPDDFSLVDKDGNPTGLKELFTKDARGEFVVKKDLDPEVKEWADEVLDNIEVRTQTLENQKISTWRRQERAKREGATVHERVKSMFNEQGRHVIKVGDDKITKTDKKAIEDAGLITDADRAAAKASTKFEGGDKASSHKAMHPVTKDPAHVAFDRIFEEQHGMSLLAASRAKKTGSADAIAEGKKWDGNLPVGKKNEFHKQARFEAVKDVNADLKAGRLKGIDKTKTVTVKTKAEQRKEDLRAIEEVHAQNVRRAKMEFQSEAAARRRANPHNFSNAAKSQRALAELEAELSKKIKAFDKMKAEAIATREAMDKALDEQLLIDLLADSTPTGRRAIKISAGGKVIGVGSKHLEWSEEAQKYVRGATMFTPKILTAATEKLGGLPILQRTWNAWSEAFTPASKLSPELNTARLVSQGRVNDVIKHHLDDVFKTFRGYPPEAQKAVLSALRNGAPAGSVNKELYDTANKYLEDLTYYTSGIAGVGSGAEKVSLRLSDINQYLPEEFMFLDKDGKSVYGHEIHTVPEMLEAMRRLKSDTDVMKVIWSLRIASEKAMAEKGLRYTVAKSYGIRRVMDEDLPMPGSQDKRVLIEALKDKHEWTTIDGFGERYYFPKDAAVEINKLLDMIKPERTQELVKLYDKALRAWKSTVTVYNPGYYSRNAIGEIIMGAFDGVTHPKWYAKASSILKYAMPDDVNEALKTLDPFTSHPTSRQLGAGKIVKLRNGQTLSKEQVWLLYNENNLTSGFISTEYDHYFPAMNTARATAAGQFATKVNDSMRKAGEKFEDYFRLAHFMKRLEQSKFRNVSDAAAEAAEYVRKYHFDYTDFTPFEKTKMMRIFPFYKWTRKAFPLMAGMLFTNPAKVNFYPKAMSALSVGTGGTDPLADENGFYPNYENVTPGWLEGLMAYPMGTDAENNMTYMNVATPAFDIYKMMQNPASATIGMLTPFGKAPLEQMLGRQLDPEFDMEMKTDADRAEHLARQTPAGSLLNSIYQSRGEGDSALLEPRTGMFDPSYDERLTSFITGLGFYENNPKRQAGEEYRRMLEEKEK